ncbi:MAG: hypothetical protein HY360_10970 [Verrucomicrobia bacterium]|nr:hypothetical protein [Verrucomicrobiota bacterium]
MNRKTALQTVPPISASLISRKAVDDLRRRLGETGLAAFHEKTEPNWQHQQTVLRERHGLDAETSQLLIMVLERLWLLPFRQYEAGSPLVVFRLAHLPGYMNRFRAEHDKDGLALARAFHILIEAILQGRATFPVDPLHLAKEVETAISSPTTLSRKNILPLARILVAGSNEDGLCGLNHYRLANPNDIALHEHKGACGQYEGVFTKAGLRKMQIYEGRLKNNPDFQRDWQTLKQAFAHVHFLDAKGIVRRSPIPERNWQREPPPQLKNPREAFQAAFDVFCWKWFLYGMKNDQPLVHKPFYAFTPHGTQLFVPGYMSLDPSRDINWKEFNRIHKARGIERQGEKLADNQRQLDEQARRLQKAAQSLKKRGLRGETLNMALIKEMYPARAAAVDKTGLDEHAESHLRQIRRLLGRKVG